jgi:hypothetical protein
MIRLRSLSLPGAFATKSWLVGSGLAFGFAGCLSGCAKYPAGGIGAASKQLVISMTVAGQINSNYVYMVALNPSTDLNPVGQGPIPIIGPPWGNGFVAGGCTYFVRWDPLQSPAYGVFTFADPTTQNNYYQVAIPVSYVDVTTGGKKLTFTLNLSQIAPSVAAANAYQSLQVNFLTMDRIPQGTVGGSKNWDALGDGRTASGVNTWITIPLNTTGTYDNNRYNGLEPSGDVVSDGDPDLDISDFSVTVQGT